MPRFVLMDGYCASHVGNDVLLESSIRILQKMEPSAEIIVHAKSEDAFLVSQGINCGRRLFPNPPSGAKKYVWLGTELVFMAAQIANSYTFRIKPHFLAFGARRRALIDYENCDYAVTIGGEMISDTFWKVLPFYLHMFWLARQCGAKVIVFPQSIGPLRKKWSRYLVRSVLSKCEVVTGRDQPAMRELEGLGLSGNQAIFSPDVGVAQPMGAPDDAIAFLSRIGVERVDSRKWIGVTCSAGSPEKGIARRNHVDVLVEGLKICAAHREIGVVILPANMPVNGTPPKDYEASKLLFERIQKDMPTVLAPREVIPARVFKAVSRELDAFISTRMHAAILSTMAPSPTITLNTQRKLGGFMDLVGQSHFSLDLDILTPQLLAERIEEALDNSSNIRSALDEARLERINSLDSYAAQLAEILNLNKAI